MTTTPTPLAAVHANTDAWWLSCAEAALAVLVKSRREFTTDDMRELGVGEPDHSCRWGSFMSTAKRRGDVVRVDFRPSKHPGRNGGIAAVWKGTPRTTTTPAN